MSLTTTTSLKRYGLAVVFLILSMALLVSPDRSAADEPAEENPPVISNGILTPGILSFEGGEVSIGADVVDDVGVSMVYAEVIGSDGTYYSLAMGPTGGTSYSASVGVPANFSEGGVNYSVYVWASDTSGLFSSQLIGDIQVPPAPQFDEAPIVWEPSVEPRQLPAAGGPVTIQVNASDNRAVSEVYAAITLADGGSAQVQLEPISSSRFEGVFNVPPNTGTAAAQYGIEITALDDIGQPASVGAGSVSVAPPPPPPTQLAVWPGSRSFGRVWIGHRAWRLVGVRNSGAKSTEPIEGMIQTSGPPFSLPWGTPQGIHFRLRPHETKVYLVEFQPSTAGLQSGSLTILRSDNEQPGLAVQLSGRGVRRR